MDNFTALYASYLRFTFGANFTHNSPHAYGILFSFSQCLLQIYVVWFPGQRHNEDYHAQIAEASAGLAATYTLRRRN